MCAKMSQVKVQETLETTQSILQHCYYIKPFRSWEYRASFSRVLIQRSDAMIRVPTEVVANGGFQILLYFKRFQDRFKNGHLCSPHQMGIVGNVKNSLTSQKRVRPVGSVNSIRMVYPGSITVTNRALHNGIKNPVPIFLITVLSTVVG